jgi:hypothetical protein
MQEFEVVDVVCRRESVEELRLLVKRIAERMRGPCRDRNVVSRFGVDVLPLYTQSQELFTHHEERFNSRFWHESELSLVSRGTSHRAGKKCELE